MRLVVPSLLKADIDGIYGRVKPHVKALIEDQLKDMQSTKVIMTLWVGLKKPVKSTITLDYKDEEDAKDVDGNTDDTYRVEIAYSGHLVMVGIFSWHLPTHSQTFIEKSQHCGHLYSGQLL